MIYVGIDMQVERKLGRGLIITLIVVTLVILAYSVITSSLSSLLELYSMDTLVSLLVITLGWIISALRLKLLFESSMKGITLPLIDSLAIRLIGGLIANITPSSIGGEPGRAYYLSRRIGVDTVKSYALVIYEVYYDVLAVNIIGACISVKYLPLSTPVLLVSLFMSLSWLSISLKIVRAGRNMPSGLDAAPRWIPGFMRKHFNKLYARYLDFASSYSEMASRISLGRKALLWLLTILYHTIWGVAALPFIHVFNVDAVVKVVEAYFIMQSFSSLPTPGGSGAAEYGLSIVLDPSVVVKYRVVYYYYGIMAGLISLIMYDNKLRRRVSRPSLEDGF